MYFLDFMFSQSNGMTLMQSFSSIHTTTRLLNADEAGSDPTKSEKIDIDDWYDLRLIKSRKRNHYPLILVS
jgi:hypothetical protein